MFPPVFLLFFVVLVFLDMCAQRVPNYMYSHTNTYMSMHRCHVLKNIETNSISFTYLFFYLNEEIIISLMVSSLSQCWRQHGQPLHIPYCVCTNTNMYILHVCIYIYHVYVQLSFLYYIPSHMLIKFYSRVGT